MKQTLILKFNDALADIENAALLDKTWHYAFAKGFLSALFELPEFDQTEFDDLCERLDRCMHGGL